MGVCPRPPVSTFLIWQVSSPPVGVPSSISSAPRKVGSLDLSEYSGLVARVIGDGNRYTLVVRTAEHSRTGLE